MVLWQYLLFIIIYSTSNCNIQINVEGWRTYHDSEYATLKYNYEFAEITLNGLISYASTTMTSFGFITIPTDLRPKQSVYTFTSDGDVLWEIYVGDGKVYRRSMTGSNVDKASYSSLLWKRRTANSTVY